MMMSSRLLFWVVNQASGILQVNNILVQNMNMLMLMRRVGSFVCWTKSGLIVGYSVCILVHVLIELIDLAPIDSNIL